MPSGKLPLCTTDDEDEEKEIGGESWNTRKKRRYTLPLRSYCCYYNEVDF